MSAWAVSGHDLRQRHQSGQLLALTNACQPASFNTIQRYKVLNVLGILPLTSKVTLPVFNSAAPVPVTLTAPPSPNSKATVNATSLDLTKLASNLADALIGGILGDLFSTGTPLTEQQRADLATKLVGGGSRTGKVRIGSSTTCSGPRTP